MNRTKPKLWTSQFLLVVCTTFLFLFCLHMLNAGTPAYVTKVTNNPAVGGSMTTAFMLGSIFTRPFISSFLSKISMKKAIHFSLLFILISILLSYFIFSISFFILNRAIEGIGFGVITTILATLATTIIPRNRLGEGVGYFAMAMSLGASLAPVVALSLFHAFSFQAVLLFTLCIIIVIFGCSLFIQSQTPAETKESEKHRFTYYIFEKKAIFPSFLIMLLCITFAGVFNFIDGLGEQTGLGAKASLFFLVFMIIILFIRPISGKLFDRKGHKLLIYPAGIFGIIGLLLLSQTNSLLILFIAAIFYGLGYGVLHPTIQSWAVSLPEPYKKGTANAMILTGMDTGMALGAPFLGEIAGQVGYKEMFSFSAFIMLLLLIFYIFKNIKEKSASTINHIKESQTEM